MKPQDYQIYNKNIDLRHQYEIFVAESQTFLHGKRPQLRRARRNGCFRRLDTMISHTFSWPMLQSHRDYLKCMLVFKSLHGLAPAYLLMNLTTCTISIHITHAIEICSVCCWLRQLSTRAPPGSAEPRSGTHFLWPCSLLASSPISASETSLARTCERAAKPRGAEERRASLQRSLIKFHLYFAQTKGNTIG